MLFFFSLKLISLSNLGPVGSAGIWLRTLQDLSACWLRYTDPTVVSPEWRPRSSLRVCGRSESTNYSLLATTRDAAWI